MEKKKVIKIWDTVFMILMRIVVLPFFFLMTFSRMMFNVFYITGTFLIFGGEFISYLVNDKKTIYDIYEKLKKQNHEPPTNH